jgi:hypothetical protein
LSKTVAVIDKIKETVLSELNFSPTYKDLRGKYMENAYYIYMDRSHFLSLTLKIGILDPLF